MSAGPEMRELEMAESPVESRRTCVPMVSIGRLKAATAAVASSSATIEPGNAAGHASASKG